MRPASMACVSRPLRVLIVDDDALVRAGLAMMLDGAEGIAVVGEAADGEEAVALAGTRFPDVVLMDLRMPGVDGVAATRRLRGTPRPPEVVVNSGCADALKGPVGASATAMPKVFLSRAALWALK